MGQIVIPSDMLCVLKQASCSWYRNIGAKTQWRMWLFTGDCCYLLHKYSCGAEGVMEGSLQQLECVSLPKTLFCSVLPPTVVFLQQLWSIHMKHLTALLAAYKKFVPYGRFCICRIKFYWLLASVSSLYSWISFVANCLWVSETLRFFPWVAYGYLSKMASHHVVFFRNAEKKPCPSAGTVYLKYCFCWIYFTMCLQIGLTLVQVVWD